MTRIVCAEWHALTEKRLEMDLGGGHPSAPGGCSVSFWKTVKPRSHSFWGDGVVSLSSAPGETERAESRARGDGEAGGEQHSALGDPRSGQHSLGTLPRASARENPQAH